MLSFSRSQRWLFLTLLLFWASSHVQVSSAQEDGKEEKESKAEKVRKALEQNMVIDFTGNNINDVLNHLKSKTHVNFVLDIYASAGGFPPIDDGMGGIVNPMIHLKSERNGKVKHTLQRFLTPYNLTFVILDDAVLITSEELGLYRQMRQRISVDVKDQPLSTALKDLARTTGINMLLDPRVAKDAQSKVSLQLDDATLETAVKLLAEMGDLKAVRMGNVLFVTSEARAEKIRREENQNPVPNPMGRDMIFPGGIAGGNMAIGGFIGGGLQRIAPPPPGLVPAVPAMPPMADPAVPPDRNVPDRDR